ncbi:carboxypeptidase regulatory-like domain-containing protein [Texcoconibacillus texcoconensis]|uniref:Carboxypeptidase regulatory-like domain-containing protein n=1 Tax=Texcoconibacillus texcoconensis TaxID=1095777 RepID=A0A840QLX0_9BACI|nr:hypothetical protein [Texcoconibacillus texcoconensis]
MTLQSDRSVGDMIGNIIDTNEASITGDNTYVLLYDEEYRLLKTTLTDHEGTFQFANMTVGIYFVSVSKEGFVTENVAVQIEENQTKDITITLQANPATLTGYVLNEENEQPLPDATVVIRDMSGFILGFDHTDEQGSFSIHGLPGTTLTFTARTDDFGILSQTIILSANDHRSLTVHLSKSTGSLTGVIKNEETSEPMNGATVKILDDTGVLIERVTDSAGTYDINLSPGQYTIVATKAKYTSQTEMITINDNQQTTTHFSLTKKPSTINGTVRDANTQKIIQGAMVIVRHPSPAGPIVRTTITDTNGNYTLNGLSADTYYIIVSDLHYGSDTAPVTIEAHETATINFDLEEREAVVSGMVTSASNSEPLANTVIHLFDDKTQILIRTLKCNGDGEYLIEGVSAGQYHIVADNPNYQQATRAVEIKSGITPIVNFALQENLTENNTTTTKPITEDNETTDTVTHPDSNEEYHLPTLEPGEDTSKTTYPWPTDENDTNTTDINLNPCMFTQPFVRCHLTNEHGEIVKKNDPQAITCNILRRENISVIVGDEEATLQKVHAQIRGWVVVTVESAEGRMVTKPLPFSKLQTFILCAPKGTDIHCRLTTFECEPTLICKNDVDGKPIFHGLHLNVHFCLSVQAEYEAVVEVNGKFCSPRKEFEESDETLAVTDMEVELREPHAIRTTKVYDWIVREVEVEKVWRAEERRLEWAFF